MDPNPLCCQQSLVLISKLPYVTFFHSLLRIMAPEYFEKQEPCLEAGASLRFSPVITADFNLSLPLDCQHSTVESRLHP